MKLYVGNLPFKMDLETLKKHFSEFGEIEDATIIVNKFTGRSKGFGFVSFKDEESAKKAMQEMNGKEVEGRKLIVNEARPMKENKPENKGTEGIEDKEEKQ